MNECIVGNGWKDRITEDKMVGWHHLLNGCEFQQTPGDSKEQGSLASCSPWGCIEQLNNNKGDRS